MSLPPSSPRLPSPPPPTEIQIGPKSPSFQDSSNSQENAMEQSIIELNSSRRIHPGTKGADMAAGPPLVPLMELDSAFQLQEHLKALHYHHTRPSTSTIVPINRQTASILATPPFGVDRALWLYELCRFLINKCNDLIVGFLFDTPACSASTCPEMRASEWQFLCAVHESPKSCCAIDYCCHTLDWATNIVTSQKIFPSRLSLTSGDVMDDKSTGVKHLTNIFRRLHRIFAHAWFQHKGVFWQVEGQTGLYVLFKTVCDNYELLPAENYKLPPEAEGLEPAVEPKVVHTILKPDPPATSNHSTGEEDMHLTAASRTNTRRHIRSSPSTGAAVTTVLEADEEESDMAQRLKTLKIKEEEEAKQDEYEKSRGNESSGHGDQEPAEELAEMTIIVDETPEKAPEEPGSAPEAATEQEGEDKIEKDDNKPSEVASSEPESADEKKVEEPKMEEPKMEEPKVEEEAEKPEAAKDSEKEPLVHTLNLDEEKPAETGVGEATVKLQSD
ncbi:hypothetical protein V493_02203 [Pseudogymnoascus sp. VKM F-4281 (FW-2241)]|nr:hypothetical protein V493_02203 [Pseudogymnoascus sp. VKM F-4281 (FW-2241)]